MSGKSGMLNGECGTSTSLRHAHSPFPIPHSAPPRPGLTLIELLVTIVILVTVLAGVIPILSPNNDARRVRTGAKQVQSMLAQAQALAAREGRPYGVAFRETQVEIDATANPRQRLSDGVAIEAFFISEPKPFAGFSEYSRVRLSYSPNFNVDGRIIMQFILADALSQPPQPFPNDYFTDPLPPYTIRRGDRLEVDGVVYRVVDEDRDGDGTSDLTKNPPFVDGDFYVATDKTFLQCVPEQRMPPLSLIVGPPPPPVPPGSPFTPTTTNPKTYKFFRQASSPATRPGNTSAPPVQLPRGVGIDFLASGVDFRIPEVIADIPKYLQFGFTHLQSRNLATFKGLDLTDPSDRPWPTFLPPLTVGIMFAPSGRLHSVVVNGEELQEDFWLKPDRVYLLVGRIENAIRTLDEIAGDGTAGSGGLADFSDFGPLPAPGDDDPDAQDIAQRRGQLNWLNGDSLWVSVAGKSGRIVTSPNDTAADPRSILRPGSDVAEQVGRQIQSARTYARDLESVGGQ